MRAEYIVHVYQQDKGGEAGYAGSEIKKQYEKIYKAKTVLKAIIEQINNEHNDHTTFQSLAIADDENCVDVENVILFHSMSISASILIFSSKSHHRCSALNAVWTLRMVRKTILFSAIV